MFRRVRYQVCPDGFAPDLRDRDEICLIVRVSIHRATHDHSSSLGLLKIMASINKKATL